MFTSYTPPFTLEWEDVHLGVTKEKGFWTYLRESPRGNHKCLFESSHSFSLRPVEPLNTPRDLTPYLMIEWPYPLCIAPKDNLKVLLHFPLEIGVFVVQAKKPELIDVFSAFPGKFTLYGDPRSGLICKYWESDASSSHDFKPSSKTGALQLDIGNSSGERLEVTKAVFNAYDMKMFYGLQQAVLQARMILMSATTAETEFSDPVPGKNLKRSTDVYPAKKTLIGSTKLMMRDGF